MKVFFLFFTLKKHHHIVTHHDIAMLAVSKLICCAQSELESSSLYKEHVQSNSFTGCWTFQPKTPTTFCFPFFFFLFQIHSPHLISYWLFWDHTPLIDCFEIIENLNLAMRSSNLGANLSKGCHLHWSVLIQDSRRVLQTILGYGFTGSISLGEW